MKRKNNIFNCDIYRLLHELSWWYMMSYVVGIGFSILSLYLTMSFIAKEFGLLLFILSFVSLGLNWTSYKMMQGFHRYKFAYKMRELDKTRK